MSSAAVIFQNILLLIEWSLDFLNGHKQFFFKLVFYTTVVEAGTPQDTVYHALW